MGSTDHNEAVEPGDGLTKPQVTRRLGCQGKARPAISVSSVTRRLPIAPHLRGTPVRLSVEGKPVRAFSGETVAAALHASEQQVLSRSLKYHRPRSFFCLDGHCGGCLMRIDGLPNQRACMTPCREGMQILGQNAYPAPDLDVLELVDWMFPGGMNHHTLMTRPALLNAVANKVVRQLSGLGELPDRAPSESRPAVRATPDIAVVGAGPAGLAAATEAASHGASTLLIDEHAEAGGSLRYDPRYSRTAIAERVQAARDAGVDIRLAHTAIGYYTEDRAPVLAVAGAGRMTLVSASRYIYATGGYASNRLFVNNDRPGVVAARAVGRLLLDHGIAAGQRICLVHDRGDLQAQALGDALETAGVEVIRAIEPDTTVVGVRGRPWVTGIELTDGSGRRHRRDCDLVAVAALPAPASEVPRQHGCAVELRPSAGGFAVVATDDGQTSVPEVLACGDVCGYVGPERAAAMGKEIGRKAAQERGTT